MPLTLHQASACEEAIDGRDLNALRAALRYEDPNGPRLGGYGMTLLHFAVEVFSPAVVVLLEHGANPLVADTDGRTALDWCGEYAVPASVEQALKDAMQRRRQADEAKVLRATMERSTPSAVSVPALSSPTVRSRL